MTEWISYSTAKHPTITGFPIVFSGRLLPSSEVVYVTAFGRSGVVWRPRVLYCLSNTDMVPTSENASCLAELPYVTTREAIQSTEVWRSYVVKRPSFRTVLMLMSFPNHRTPNIDLWHNRCCARFLLRCCFWITPR